MYIKQYVIYHNIMCTSVPYVRDCCDGQSTDCAVTGVITWLNCESMCILCKTPRVIKKKRKTSSYF